MGRKHNYPKTCILNGQCTPTGQKSDFKGLKKQRLQWFMVDIICYVCIYMLSISLCAYTHMYKVHITYIELYILYIYIFSHRDI